MIGWIKKLFGMSEANVSTVETKAVEPAPVKRQAPSKPQKAKATVAKKPAKKSKTPDLSAMTKTELDIYGRKIGLKLDRRRTKEFMMQEIEKHNKEN